MPFLHADKFLGSLLKRQKFLGSYLVCTKMHSFCVLYPRGNRQQNFGMDGGEGWEGGWGDWAKTHQYMAQINITRLQHGQSHLLVVLISYCYAMV